jgi:23S rRNA (pseudouridine1915-N3)-methyltransferase
MLKLRILSVGKTKEAWLDQAIEEYVKRLQGIIHFEFIWAKDNQQLLNLTQKESTLICLDPMGKHYSSEEFAHFFDAQCLKGGCRLAWVIGGAEGLPAELRKKPTLLSLSSLTFTHQITRLVLIEQIYRAIEINRGSPYHK